MSVICANCQKRLGTIDWVGEGGTLAFSHGFYVKWCEVCALEEQIKHAEERAAILPELRAQLAEALELESRVSDAP